jgi:hypothetical protein
VVFDFVFSMSDCTQAAKRGHFWRMVWMPIARAIL